MREMKNSGIAWAGVCPSLWKTEKFKYHFKRRTVKNPGEAQVLSLYREYGVIPKDSRDDNHNVTSEDTSKYLFVRKGDFVINKMKAWQGSVAVSEYEGIVSPAYYVYEFVGKTTYRRYIHYLMRNKALAAEFRRLSGGIREGQWDLAAASLENSLIFIPPMQEQQAIANYLDTKCAEIDALMEDIRAEISILEEYKKSVITEAVTKGLNPDAEMKDSGVAWVGKCPEHWHLKKGKYLLNLQQKPVLESDGVITCFRDGEVTLRSKRREEGFTIAEKEHGYQGVDTGDLVVHGMDGFAGAIGISDSRGKASPVLNVLDTEQDKLYVMFYLRSMAYGNIFLAMATGIRVRSCDLRWNKLAELRYPVPPLHEQKEISSYLVSKCAEIDSTISDKQEQLSVLEEYKKSLIYEYVTGKKEVP